MTREKFTALVAANELRRLDLSKMVRRQEALKQEIINAESAITTARAELLKEEG